MCSLGKYCAPALRSLQPGPNASLSRELLLNKTHLCAPPFTPAYPQSVGPFFGSLCLLSAVASFMRAAFINLALSPFTVILRVDERAITMQAEQAPVTFLSKDTGEKKKKKSVCLGCVSLSSTLFVDHRTRGPSPEHVSVCRVCACVRGASAVLNSSLCCLCQREKGNLCLCRMVVQEGVE